MPERISILVVDDEPIIIMSAERVLRAEGYDVEGVAGGKEAMQRMDRNHYDIVLTDLRMLEGDGISLIKWIRQFHPGTGIVVITGHLLQETIKEALKLGVHDHMMKPFAPAVLKDVIHKTIEWMRENTAERALEEEFPAAMRAELDEVIDQCRHEPRGTIPVLVRAQEIFGYLPPAIQKHVARGLNIYPSEIHSIVSSNPFFRTSPGGDHTIMVCLCAECYLKGSARILGGIREALKIEPGETTGDGRFTLSAGRCVHACGQGPVMVIDKDIYRALTRRKAIGFINKYSPGCAFAPPVEYGAAQGKEMGDA